MLFPLLPFILEVGLIIYWVAVTAVLYSAGYPVVHWRTASQQVQPLSFQQLMLTNSSMTAPAATTQPNITGMSNQVGCWWLVTAHVLALLYCCRCGR